MKHTLRITYFILSLLIFPATKAIAGNFLAMAAPYPPYSVSCGLKVEGMSVKTLTTIMDMCNTPITEKEIKLTPWAYAYETTARTPRRIMLNAHRTPKTERLYKWVGPITTSRHVLIGRKQDNFFIPTKNQLRHFKIATIRWSRPEKALLASGIPEDQITRSPTHVQALRRLDKGEVHLFAYTERGIPHLLKGLGMDQSNYAVYYTFDEEPLYFAFSRDTDDVLIDRLNRALKDLKATGEGGFSAFDRMFPATRME